MNSKIFILAAAVCSVAVIAFLVLNNGSDSGVDNSRSPSGLYSAEPTEAEQLFQYSTVSSLIAENSFEQGRIQIRRCTQCHSFDEGGSNKVGPALYGILGRKIASVEGFAYSAALKRFGENEVWDYENLNGFLWNPKKYLTRTSMNFAGVPKPEDRAAVIAYLRTLSNDPLPLPVK